MKQLLLLRHAKTERTSSSGRDEDRQLNERGVEDAPLVGKLLRKLDCVPDRILCSTAVRTRQTVDLLLPKLKAAVEPEYLPSMYLADAHFLWDLVCRQTAGERLLLVGHNPGVEALISHACGGASRVQMPTAALASIELLVDDWRMAGERGGFLAWLVTPAVLHALS